MADAKPIASKQPPPQPLHKSVFLPILGAEVEVKITMDVLEVVERVYDMSCDVVGINLGNPGSVKRYQVAEVVHGWCRLVGAYEKNGWTRAQVREDVMLAPTFGRLRRIVGCIQGAVLHTLKYVDEKDFERLCRGEDIEGNLLSPETGEPLDPSAGAPASSPSASPSPAAPSSEAAGD